MSEPATESVLSDEMSQAIPQDTEYPQTGGSSHRKSRKMSKSKRARRMKTNKKKKNNKSKSKKNTRRKLRR